MRADTDFSLLLRFGLVGLSTTMLFMGLTYGLVEGAGLHATLASTISAVATICYNYTLHYHFTFTSDAPHGRVLVRYLLMCVGTVTINALVMQIGQAALSMHYLYIQVISLVVVMTWNLCVSALWVYKSD